MNQARFHFLAIFILGAVSGYSQAVPKEMQLFLLIGQSNMAGRGGVEVQDQVSNPRIYMLNGILQNLPKTVPQCAVVSSRGLTDKGDHLHFDAGALRTFGKRYAEAFIALKSGESKP